MTRGTWCVLGAAAVFVAALTSSLRAAPARPPQAQTQTETQAQSQAQDRTQAQSDSERGERLMNASCQDCHEVRRLQVQAKTADEWTKTVQDMVQKGAKIEADDIPVLVDYLVDHYGPLPDGPGKVILLNVCTMCHDLGRIRHGRRSAQEWEETLEAMLNEGAPLSDQDFAVVGIYLSRNFGID